MQFQLAVGYIMKILLFFCFVKVTSVYCVPTTFYTSIDENDITNDTQTISEGDEAAPCLVSDILYNHGQQIERSNECDYCLCVDGDMFCYWQCATKPSSNTISVGATETSSTTPAQVVDAENFTSLLLDKLTRSSLTMVPATVGTLVTEAASNYTGQVTVISSSPSTLSLSQMNTTTSKPNNQTCVVIGVEYTEGDLLPQEEGSCLQCVCGANGRVTCSPQDCVSLQQDRYRHGLESNSLDMFDVDIF